MPLPTLKKWGKTSKTLHQAALLFAPLRSAVAIPEPNHLHLAMNVYPYGLARGMGQGSELGFDFKRGELIYYSPSGGETTFVLTDHTQASLFEALLATMKQDVLADFLADVRGETLVPGFLEKLNSEKGTSYKLEDVYNDDLIGFKSKVVSKYADVLYTVFTGIARFKARLIGPMTPIVVWPEHFDLSTLWFATPEMEESKPHMNFGFAPFSASFEQPYLYAYAYPYPEGYQPPTLPGHAYWHNDDYTGVAVDYEEIAKADKPELFIEQLCVGIYEALLPAVQRR